MCVDERGLSYQIWGQAVCPRIGMCVSLPAAGFWVELNPKRRGGGLFESPAASFLAESPAKAR